MKNKHLNIRASEKTLRITKTRSKFHSISQSEFVKIAVELVKDDDILQYKLDKINDRYKRKTKSTA